MKSPYLSLTILTVFAKFLIRPEKENSQAVTAEGFAANPKSTIKVSPLNSRAPVKTSAPQTAKNQKRDDKRPVAFGRVVTNSTLNNSRYANSKSTDMA